MTFLPFADRAASVARFLRLRHEASWKAEDSSHHVLQVLAGHRVDSHAGLACTIEKGGILDHLPEGSAQQREAVGRNIRRRKDGSADLAGTCQESQDAARLAVASELASGRNVR